MAIALNDISYLLVLPVTGKSVCQLEGIESCTAAKMITHSLGIN